MFGLASRSVNPIKIAQNDCIFHSEVLTAVLKALQGKQAKPSPIKTQGVKGRKSQE